MATGQPTYPADPPARPRRSRSRRRLIAVVGFLVVSAALLVVADRAAVAVAERTVADRVRQEAADRRAEVSLPQVRVAGFPFLTQVLAGRYEEIHIRIRELTTTTAGGPGRITDLNIEARNVAASVASLRTGAGQVVAASVTGTGVIPYGSVEQLIGRPDVRLAERDGKLAVTAPLDVLGQRLTVRGTADVLVEAGEVRLRFDELTADGLPPTAAAQALLAVFAEEISVDIPMGGLPFELTVEQVRVLPAGLAVTATGRDVPLGVG
ncbi:MAG TPA: DUF2993 domain-containing protein [Micromonosporaceae bacterium]